MRIEGNHDRRSIFGMGVPRGSGDDSLVTEMHTVERADGEKEGTVQLREIGRGMENFHQTNDE